MQTFGVLTMAKFAVRSAPYQFLPVKQIPRGRERLRGPADVRGGVPAALLFGHVQAERPHA